MRFLAALVKIYGTAEITWEELIGLFYAPGKGVVSTSD